MLPKLVIIAVDLKVFIPYYYTKLFFSYMRPALVVGMISAPSAGDEDTARVFIDLILFLEGASVFMIFIAAPVFIRLLCCLPPLWYYLLVPFCDVSLRRPGGGRLSLISLATTQKNV